MKRIAIIDDGFVRDTQVFIEDPATINTNPDWENNFVDMKHPCQYVGVFEGKNEEEILIKAAAQEGVHIGVITLIEI